jgi:hypothetical protein
MRRHRRKSSTVPGAESISAVGNIGIASTGDNATNVLILGSVAVAARMLDSSGWPVVADWDPLSAGVHRAKQSSDGSAIPPYVARDVDEHLRSCLHYGRTKGTFTLIVGDSTAGKTRAAFEAVHSILADYKVFVPRSADDIRAFLLLTHSLPRPCILWLDDLDRYLGRDGIDSSILDAFLRKHTVIVGTMRAERFEAIRDGRESHDAPDRTVGDPQTASFASQVLRMVETIQLDRLWSPSELDRLEAYDDGRLIDAYRHHGPYGIAEYLAGGPLLWQEWRNAIRAGGHPRGAAIVAVSVDLARAGLTGARSSSLIVKLHERYLTMMGGARLRPENLEDALDWATRVRFGVSSLLMPGSEPDTLYPFDYIVDTAMRERNFPLIPEFIWEAARENERDEADRMRVFYSTYRAHVSHPGYQIVSSAELVAEIKTLLPPFSQNNHLHLDSPSSDSKETTQEAVGNDQLPRHEELNFDVLAERLSESKIVLLYAGGGAPFQAEGIVYDVIAWSFRSRSTSCQIWVYGPDSPVIRKYAVADANGAYPDGASLLESEYGDRYGWRLNLRETEVSSLVDLPDEFELDTFAADATWSGHIDGAADFGWLDYEASWMSLAGFEPILKYMLNVALRNLIRNYASIPDDA